MSQSKQPSSPIAAQNSASDAPVPVWLIVFMVLLLVWGGLYFDDHGGWFSPQVYGPYRSLVELEPYQPKSEGGLAAQGKSVYGKTCVACHQATGMGAAGQFPPLAGSEWVSEADPGRIIRLVLNGLQGPITVKGQNYNNVMVPWNSLSDEDIAAVITYIRGNKEWGNNASPVTPERVKAVREKLKGRSAAFTAEELLKISPAD
ncbi:MAG: cytochrome c [Verrucomicrobiota bacterium]